MINKSSICPAAKIHSKDKWRLLWVLNHEVAEEKMIETCSFYSQRGCEGGSCGRWFSEKVNYIKRRIGIYPSDQQIETLKEMMDRIRNMSDGEYNTLCNSLPKKEKE